MWILAFDTSSESQSVVLMEGDRVLAESFELSVTTHSETLLPTIDRLLKDAGLKLKQIEGFGLTIGPGSFTGLRIGIATLKGLAVANPRPVAALSTLAALVEPQRSRSGEVIASLDARMEEVFTLRWETSRKTLEDEFCLPVKTWIDSLRASPHAKFAIGSGALKYRGELRAIPGVEVSSDAKDHQISPQSLGRLASQALQSGKTTDWAQLKAHYWRASEAENRLRGSFPAKIP